MKKPTLSDYLIFAALVALLFALVCWFSVEFETYHALHPQS